jgi:hypothetical protein
MATITLEIGDQLPLLPASFTPPAQICARPIQVQSSHLGLLTHAEPVGGSHGKVIHARSFARSRRIVMLSGLTQDAAVAVGDSLTELREELSATEIWVATIKSADRYLSVMQPGQRPPIDAVICVFREAGRGEWYVSDNAIILRASGSGWLRTSPPGRIPPMRQYGKASEGTMELQSGDALLAWCGSTVSEAALMQRLARRTEPAPPSPAAGQGCLLIAERND